LNKGSSRPKIRKRRFYPSKRKVCSFCRDNIADIDYKDVSRLRQYTSDTGKIERRRKTGTCAKHQRSLAKAIKRARYLALLPYASIHISENGAEYKRRRDAT
jgi:small subunit ribosomal protein S18